MCIFVEEAPNFPTTWFSESPVKSKSHDLKSDPDITQSPEYWVHYRSLAGSPFDSSDSDSSSDGDDDAVSLGSLDLSSPFSDVSLVSEGIGTLNVMESNALGLVFMSEEVLETKAIATSTPQAESLRAPHNHQDDRSCGRPNQKYYAQFPQDIGLCADMSDDTGPKGAHWYDDGSDQPYNLPRAPRLGTIPLPEDDGEELLYGGPDLGGWVTGTLDGIPKVVLPGLSCLDIGLPMPFAMED